MPEPGRPEVLRDGASWPLGTTADVAWITDQTTVSLTINAAIPLLFDAYATIVLPFGGDGQDRHDRALLAELRSVSPGQPWWLGYLDTGADDIVFPEAAGVTLYSGWRYVLVQAGPDQAAGWRRRRAGSVWSGRLPNLMFPADLRWLVSTLWDDDWTCVGGPVELIDGLCRQPELRSRTRRVDPYQNATPPGHEAI